MPWPLFPEMSQNQIVLNSQSFPFRLNILYSFGLYFKLFHLHVKMPHLYSRIEHTHDPYKIKKI